MKSNKKERREQPNLKSNPSMITSAENYTKKRKIEKKKKPDRQNPRTNGRSKAVQGFPGGTVVEGLPANAGDTGSRPGLRGSHMPRSNWAHEPRLLSLRVWSLCSATREAAMRGPCTAMKSGPHLPQLEKALEQKRRSNTAINK